MTLVMHILDEQKLSICFNDCLKVTTGAKLTAGGNEFHTFTIILFVKNTDAQNCCIYRFIKLIYIWPLI